jgi:hypothetical protein
MSEATPMRIREAYERSLADLAALREALQFYADLGPDDIPYHDTINDPPDVGRTAREALSRVAGDAA